MVISHVTYATTNTGTNIRISVSKPMVAHEYSVYSHSGINLRIDEISTARNDMIAHA